MTRSLRRIGLAIASAVVVVAAFAIPAWSRSAPNRNHVVSLTIHYSRFSRDALHVKVGDLVRFAVQNLDPIEHELIVGDDGVQAQHEQGDDLLHHGVPGAVSVAARTSATTTYRFDRPGRLTFACHLPGHFAYGMHGVIDVEP